MKRILILVLFLAGIGIFSYFQFSPPKPDPLVLGDTSSHVSPSKAPTLPASKLPEKEKALAEKIPEIFFQEITIVSERPGAELAKKFGSKNVATILAINRIDDRHLGVNTTLIAPTSFKNPTLWEFMPADISTAQDIPKLVIVSQRTQAFGFYENGVLVRSGPVSSGKQATPTANGLYFANWKGEKVVSTVDDSWILKWNINIDNKKGISLHQYTLPGYPASHSCVRFYAQDARWLYRWINEWTLTPDGSAKIENGTPVLIYGSYDFDKTAPWKRLLTDPNATKITEEELTQAIANNLIDINK